MLDPLTEACCFGILILSVAGWLQICLRQRRLILESPIAPLDATDSVYPVGLLSPVDSTSQVGLPAYQTVPGDSTGPDNYTTRAKRASSVNPVSPDDTAPSGRSLRPRPTKN